MTLLVAALRLHRTALRWTSLSIAIVGAGLAIGNLAGSKLCAVALIPWFIVFLVVQVFDLILAIAASEDRLERVWSGPTSPLPPSTSAR